MTAPRDQETDPRPEDENSEPTAGSVTEEEPEETTAAAETAAADADVAAEEPTLEETLRAERDDFEQKWLRVVAELDNVRKRSRREVSDTRRFARADILRSLLEFQDHFERALQSAGDSPDTGGSAGFREGIELIYQKFLGLLKDHGVEPMEALGEEFDPNFHEAVGQLATEDTAPGIVIEVVQQGFHFGDLVLRPARVMVSS
jgi:molecular chaperone GrpE